VGEPPALTILYLPNQGVRYLFKILKVLCSSAAVKIIMALGNRPRLIRRVRRFGERLQCRMEVTGWVPGIHRRMLEADLVITKAGGATVHEALAAGCPVIISQVTPGQEEGNARLIESLGLGLVVRNDHSLHKLVKFLRQVDFEMLDNMRRNVEKFRRADAPFRIARRIRAALESAPDNRAPND
jgi:UDP-N-acetylglucosamine:LPS N-acetylglucosamine transferase